MVNFVITTLQELQMELKSVVPLEEQQRWEQISRDAIKAGDIEELSIPGLFQVIEKLAYEYTTDVVMYIEELITEEEWENILNKKTLQLEKIHDTTALATGVHPECLAELIEIKTEQYASKYINQLNSRDLNF